MQACGAVCVDQIRQTSLLIINPGKCITLFETRKRSLRLTNINYMSMYVIVSIKILWLANTQKTKNNKKKHFKANVQAVQCFFKCSDEKVTLLCNLQIIAHSMLSYHGHSFAALLKKQKMFSAVTEAPSSFKLKSIYIRNKYGQKHFSICPYCTDSPWENTDESHKRPTKLVNRPESNPIWQFFSPH